MADSKHIEKIEKKVLLEDRLERSEGKHAAKIVFGGVGGALLGAVGAIAHYVQSASREVMRFVHTVAAKRGVPVEKVMQSLRSDPALAAQLQERIIQAGHVNRLHSNMLPAIGAGAVIGGVVISYLDSRHQQTLKGKIQKLDEEINTENKNDHWEKRISAPENTDREIKR